MYADETCIFNQRVKKIENDLNSFRHYATGKLSIYFREDKTKSILFSKTRGLKEISVSFADHSIKQHETVKYFGCQLDSRLSGEAVASNVLKKKTVELKFLYRQSRYLAPAYKSLLCNVLIHPHFDYECSS